MRRLLRRLLFWLPPKATNEERTTEIGPDHELVVAVTSPDRVPRYRQLRYSLRLMSRGERNTLYIASAVLCLSLILAAAAFIRSHTALQPTAGGTLTEALIGQPKYLNPLDALANDTDRDLVRLIYSGLFRQNGMAAAPDLAESYTWSDDGKTLTVKLRHGAQFHDGQPLSAEDVQFTFDALQDPSRKSPLLPLFQGVKLTTVDDYTLTFTLNQPDASFLTKLTFGIMPSNLWQDIPAESAQLSDLNVKPIGSGPYRVKAFTRDNLGAIHSYTLERFDGYYGTKPFIQDLVFQFFSDRQESLDAFKSGLVDSVAFINQSDIDKMGSGQRIKNISLEMPQETVAFFNLKNKTLTDKNVRLSLALAVDRSEIITALHGSAAAVSGPFPFGAVDASATQYDLERARTLLTQAGWVVPQNSNVRIWAPAKKAAPAPSTKGKKKIITPVAPVADQTVTATASSTELALTILIPDDPDLLAIAATLKRQWSLVGARVTIEPIAMEDLMRRATRERNEQIVLLNVLLGPEQDMFPFWWSGQATDRGLNISGLSDHAVDDALNLTRNVTSTQNLETARQKLTAALALDIPALFLDRPTQHYLVADKIHGMSDKVAIAEPAERFSDLLSWYIKTGWHWK